MRGMRHIAVPVLGGLAASAAVMVTALSLIDPRPFTGGQLVTAAVAVAPLSLAAACGLRRRGGDRSTAVAVRRLEVLDRVGTEIVWDCDATGRFTYASPQCLELLGYTQAEVRSLRVLDVVHPDERAEVAELLTAGQGWWRRPFRCVGKDGREVWLRSSALAHRDDDGELFGLSGASHVLSGEAPDPVALRAAWVAVHGLLRGDGLTIAFQPIFALAAERVLGVEALSRFAVPGDTRTPQDWFADAAAVGLGADLELRALDLALKAASSLPEQLYVSVNLSPQTLLRQEATEILTRSAMPPARIVVEVTEQTPVEDYERLIRALGPLRDAGVRIAVDDAGAGYACFRHILCLEPDVIKLDRTLIAGIDTDPARRALAGAVATFAHDVGATLVAEGIERPGEIEAVLALGIDAGQGYLLGRPSTAATDWLGWLGDVRSGPRPAVMADKSA